LVMMNVLPGAIVKTQLMQKYVKSHKMET